MSSTGGTYLFVEAQDFTSAVKEYFGSDEAYAAFQAELAKQPEKAPSSREPRPYENFGGVISSGEWESVADYG